MDSNIYAALTFLVGALLGFIFGRIPRYSKWREGYAARLRKRLAPIVKELSGELDRHIKEEGSRAGFEGAGSEASAKFTTCSGRKNGNFCGSQIYRCNKCQGVGCQTYGQTQCSNEKFHDGKCKACGNFSRSAFESSELEPNSA